jgi:hypothetical protein
MTRIVLPRGGIKVKRGGGKIRQDNARRQGTTAGQAAEQDDKKKRYTKEIPHGKTVQQN